MSKTYHKLQAFAKQQAKDGEAWEIIPVDTIIDQLKFLQLDVVHYIVDHRSQTIFFTPHHGYSKLRLPSEFMEVADYIQNRKAAGCGDNLTTIDEVIGEKYKDFTRVNSIQELVPIMDKFHPEYGHVKGDEPNWQPEHFPVGTVVEMAEIRMNTETGETSFYSQDKEGYVPLKATVTGVVRNGINSYCVITDRHSELTGFDTYNFSHIGRIIKRGDGPVVWKSYKLEPYLEKSRLQIEPLGPKHYWWRDINLLIPHVMQFIPGNSNSLLRSVDISSINLQTFVKKKKFFYNYTVFHCRKKKLRRFVQQNFNRWKLTAKEIQKLQREEDEDFNRRMHEDMDYMENHLGPTGDNEEITQGINSYGNNQNYLNGEEVCGECRNPYVNRGPSPIGEGMSCQLCREADIRESTPWGEE